MKDSTVRRFEELEHRLATVEHVLAEQNSPPVGWPVCPRCADEVMGLPPRRICNECETEVGVRLALGQRDRTAAIEGAAITLRAHKKSVTHSGCICGWERESTDHARHVAEQLAAVGALGDTEPSPVDADTERRLRAGRISTFILTHRMHERDPRADACACGWTPASDVKRGEWRSAHLRHIFEQIEAAEIES